MLGTKGIATGERRNGILGLLNREGKVSVSHLTKTFNTSDTTIRNDLREMEHEGLLRRVHGGAVSVKKAYYEMSLNDRMSIRKDEKIRIAKACANRINEGETLMIDSGTTTRYLARELAQRSNLTVVTNAVQIAQEFVYNNSVSVILLGGNLDLQYQFAFGNETVSQLKKYRANKVIVATDGISAQHGLTTYHHQEADVSRQMIERSNQVIVVADSSKIGKEGFSYITSSSSVDILITGKDEAIIPQIEAFRKRNIEVEQV